MLTNPIFYKIEMVGKAKRTGTARGKQVKAGKAIIEARLDEQHRNIPFNEGRLKARQAKKARRRETKRRTGKNRKPPVKRAKIPVPISEESHSQEADRSSDENFPDVPSVRVLRTRVIVSEEEEEEEEIDELEDEEMDEVEDELDHMDVDDEDDYMDF